MALLATLALVPMGRAEIDASGVSVALVTGSTTVTPGSEFDVEIVLTEAGAALNAFEAIVRYDPAALTRLSLSPLSLQEGALLKAACGTRFHLFRAGADRDTITEALLCNQVSVSGPGQLYRLRFRASTTPQSTTLYFPSTPRFYDAGLAVAPVTASDLTIDIEATVSTPSSGATGALNRLRVSPNPAVGAVMVSVNDPGAVDGEVIVRDLAGRSIRRLPLAVAGWQWKWDGRAQGGATVPAGVYLVELRARGSVSRAKVVLMR